MKIVYFVEDYSTCGGVERIITEKASRLASMYGHEVTIISAYEDSRPIRFKTGAGVNTLFLHVPMARRDAGAAIKFIGHVKALFTAAARLDKVLRELRPDVIFFTTTLGAVLLPLCRTRAKKVYESHLARRFERRRALMIFTELRADTVVCLTEGDAADWRHARRVRVIPNFNVMPPSMVKDYGTRRAIAVGRMERQKGFDTLVDVWNIVVRHHPDWRLDIYGEGPLHRELQDKIDAYGLTDIVTLCGVSDNISERYAEHSLHLMPSRYEGLPMTLIEAQSCGLPSVAFNFRYGASDIIRDGENGLLVRQGDTPAFKDAVLKMIEHPELRERYGQQGVLAAEKFSAANIMPEWDRLLREL